MSSVNNGNDTGGTLDDYKRLLLNNKAWVAEKLAVRPDYFERTANVQRPKFLWIGCSDSRVPAEDITGTEAGELFVHRNIANLCIPTDFNMLAVLQYAVEILEVKHVIVCGHYGCGGIRTAMSKTDLGLINRWLHDIKDTYRLNATELDDLPGEEERASRLVELNVIAQTRRLANTAFIQRAWKDRQRPTLHGWVYSLRTGEIKDLWRINPGEHDHDIHEYNL